MTGPATNPVGPRPSPTPNRVGPTPTLPAATLGTNLTSESQSGGDIAAHSTGPKAGPAISPLAAAAPEAGQVSQRLKHPLIRFSLQDKADELEAAAADTTPLLGSFVMNGQATMIYAAPNTGKTLIILDLVLKAIQKGRIDADSVIYVNADDGSAGLACKNRLLSVVGAHMMSPGQRGMKIRHLTENMQQAVQDGTARGTLIIIDTRKKFTDLMDKKRTSEFGQICREYVLAGGTVLALGHTRKTPKPDGRPQYQGTTDILEDFDAVYLAELVKGQKRTDRKVVLFEMEKKRADSPDVVAYAYVDERGASYEEKLASVEAVDPDDYADYRRPDPDVAEYRIQMAIADIIGDGFSEGKMALAEATAKACGISRSRAIRVINQGTGSTPGVHLWNTETGAHNKQTYQLIIFDGQ